MSCLNWRHRPACYGYPPEWWEIHTSGALPEDNRRAIGICGRCPALDDCRTEADEAGPRYRNSVILAAVPHNSSGQPRTVAGLHHGRNQFTRTEP